MKSIPKKTIIKELNDELESLEIERKDIDKRYSYVKQDSKSAEDLREKKLVVDKRIRWIEKILNK